MAFTFNLLRENDLFWSYWTNNYLKGLKPAAFDLLYWNTDGTNLPYRMHSYYLREMYLHNRLVQPDALTMNGETINLSEIRVPSFFLSARQPGEGKLEVIEDAPGSYVKVKAADAGH